MAPEQQRERATSASARLRAESAALPADWRPLVHEFLEAPRGVALCGFLDERAAAGAMLYPPHPLRALELTPMAQVRVVILGQDPYHGPGQAHGLAFSVPEGIALPPSLRNIFAELVADCACGIPASGDLQRWARQGVLLLNAVLTVEDGTPGAHAGKGWEILTDRIVERVAAERSPKAFLLWGAHAQAKRSLIQAAGAEHLVLTANHPSPLSARRPPQPFFGCRHFSQANAFLTRQGSRAVQWCA